jgi:hypothetical protein
MSVHTLYALCLVLFCSQALAKDVILHISFTDGFAFTESGMRDLSEIFRKQLPTARIVTVQAPTKRLGYLTSAGAEAPRKKILDQLTNGLIGPNEQIRLMVLSTHASSTNSKTELQEVGAINATGLDSRAKEFFAPLAGLFSPDARIVLEACSTLCGTEQEAGQRVSRLLEFLRIPNGSLFGATTPLTSSYSTNNSWKMFFLLGLGTLAGTELLSVTEIVLNREAFASLAADAARWKFGMIFLKNFGLASAAVFGMRYGVIPFVQLFAEVRGALNAGKIFRVSKSDELVAEDAKYSLDRDRVFFDGVRTCEDLFTWKM